MSTPREVFANRAASTLSAAITSTTATTLTVASAAPFPTTSVFRILIDSEIMSVVGVSGSTFTVVRGNGGTLAATHASGAAVTMILTAESLRSYARNNVPYFDNSDRPPFVLYDASGNVLTKSSFTAVNAGSSTINDNADGSVSVVMPKMTGSGENIMLLTRTAPDTPYSVILAADATIIDGNGWSGLGAGFSYSGTNEVLAQFYSTNGAGSATLQYAVASWNSPTSFNTRVLGAWGATLSAMKWFKLTDDGTNIIFSASHNGIDWVDMYSTGRLQFSSASHTADRVGFMIRNASNTTNSVAATLLSWSGA